MMMRWNTLKYLFKEGIVGLWKNRAMAFASAGTIVLCLLILGMSYSIGTNIDYVLKQLEMKFGITAYVQDGLGDNKMLDLRSKIEKIPHVSKVIYISKEDALKSFSEENQSEIFSDFLADNPLPASFEITVNDVAFQGQVVGELKKFSELDIKYLAKETDMFIKINNTINYIAFSIIICLVIVGLMLMTNTIKLTVYIRRKEINIMKYIGATDWFIRLPFLIEGLAIGTLGALASIFIIVISYNGLSEALMSHLIGMMNGITFKSTADVMKDLIPVFLAIGIGIGLIGSGTAIRKHLKV